MASGTLPHDLDAEQAVLGCLLIDPDAIHQVRGVVEPSDFYAERNGRILRAALSLLERNEPVDILTLKVELQREGVLRVSGGLEYLAELSQKMPTAASVRHYAGIVRDFAVQRQLAAASADVHAAAMNGHYNREKALATLQGTVASIQARYAATEAHAEAPTGAWTADEILGAQDVDEPVDWLPFLDREGVIAEGMTHLIAGYTGAGKSPLLQFATVGWLRGDRRVVWVSEEPKRVWRAKLDTLQALYGSKVPWPNLRIVPVMGRRPPELLSRVSERAFDIMVLDTLRTVCQPLHQNDADDVRRAVVPWQTCASDQHATLIVLHHLRKAEGEHGERISGTEGIPALFDNVFEYSFTSSPDRRALRSVRVRHGGDPLNMVVARLGDDFGELRVLAEGGYTVTRERDVRIVEILEEADRDLLTSEIQHRYGASPPSLGAVLRSLMRLAQRGAVLRTPPLDVEVRGRRVTWRAADLFTQR